MSHAAIDAHWREGERVRLRGSTWTIAAVTTHGDCAALHLHGAAGLARTILTPFDRPRRMERSASRRRVTLRRWLHTVRRAACAARPFGAVADPLAATINLLPYQLEPTLAIVRHGVTRVLVADAVGLGKTIQSGLLLHTLIVRHPLLRALIVTPAGLRAQWASELAARFRLEATVCDASWLRRSALALPPDIAPWALPGVFIVSFDFLKRPEVLRPLEDLTWDLVVVDEAHNASATSARRVAVHAAALRSTRVLLLTATPHAGDTAQFNALCAIGATSSHDPIVLFRRSRADAGLGTRRRSVMLTVTPSEAERHLHRLLDRYTAAVCRESRGRADGRPRLMATVLKKRALSSAASLSISVRRRLDLLAGAAPATQLLLPLGDEDMLADEVDDGALGAPGLGDVALEQRLLRRIVGACDDVAAESKAAFLVRLLRRAAEPAIIFTEYRDTLARLRDVLVKAGHDVTVLHGGQIAAERAEAQHRFNNAGGMLLATDAASEGLNLHERCRLVVHYELPWTPSRLEQRTGRVDRIGQCRTVHEVLLVAGHPAERLVLAPLARRAARVRLAIGSQSRALDRLAESTVADAVLDGVPLDDFGSLDTEPQVPLDLRAEATVEAARLAGRRAWRSRSGLDERRDSPVVVTSVRRRRLSQQAAIYALSLTSRGGRVEHRELIALAGTQQNSEEILACLEPKIEDTRAMYTRVQRSMGARARARANTASAARALVQASLFDRRAVLAAQERARAATRHAEDLEHDDDTQLVATLDLLALLE